MVLNNAPNSYLLGAGWDWDGRNSYLKITLESALLCRLATLQWTILRFTALSRAEIYSLAASVTLSDEFAVRSRTFLANVLNLLRTARFRAVRVAVCKTSFCAAFLFAIYIHPGSQAR